VQSPPSGFRLVKEGRLRVLVREDVGAEVLPLVRHWAADTLPAARAPAGGRGGAGVFDLAGSAPAVVLRPFLRGGLMAKWNRRFYFGWRARPLVELRVTETLRRAGVPTVEPIAAAVLWIVPGCHRGALLSREIPLAVNLWNYLREADRDERGRVCEDAARAARRLHDAGALHPDLNLQNFLVRRTASGREVLVIDLDKARVVSRVSARQRRVAFERICRSMRRLDPTAEVITLACVEAFHSILMAPVS